MKEFIDIDENSCPNPHVRPIEPPFVPSFRDTGMGSLKVFSSKLRALKRPYSDLKRSVFNYKSIIFRKEMISCLGM